jgi:gamma-glutamyl phosphate reductase
MEENPLSKTQPANSSRREFLERLAITAGTLGIAVGGVAEVARLSNPVIAEADSQSFDQMAAAAMAAGAFGVPNPADFSPPPGRRPCRW